MTNQTSAESLYKTILANYMKDFKEVVPTKEQYKKLRDKGMDCTDIKLALDNYNERRAMRIEFIAAQEAGFNHNPY